MESAGPQGSRCEVFAMSVNTIINGCRDYYGLTPPFCGIFSMMLYSIVLFNNAVY